MINKLIPTKNVQAIREALKIVEPGRSSTKRICVIKGPPGGGKTATTSNYYAGKKKMRMFPCIYLRILPVFTPTWMLRKLGDKASVKDTPRNACECLEALIDYIGSNKPMILFDEAHRMAGSSKMTQIIKDLHDAGASIALIGENSLERLLKRDIPAWTVSIVTRLSIFILMRPMRWRK
jgi:DNA transposition AAA+ family ATPase